ncbi:MAG: PQQ-dependent sugar dehydrogenase [Gemmataceae bacterium]|nr:PQQ-dependent sugar dehydrogenase [Gemmataceae bacterium]
MRRVWFSGLAILTLALLGLPFLLAQGSGTTKKVVGIEKRVPWTTSKIVGSPEPPAPYRTERAFPKITFSEPLDMTSVPGTDWMLVAERWGKIWAFRNAKDAADKTLVLELKPGKNAKGEATKPVIYAVAVPPKKLEEKGELYITYVADSVSEQPKGTQVARFTLTQTKDRLVADPASETVVYAWPSGGHNGGCLKFSPKDECLYIGTGDGSGIADQLQIGQDLGSPLGKILRVKPTPGPDGKPYSIPNDNPFVNTPGALPEVWAYGLRQPWRYTFDRATGDLWCGEVGQDLWEMVYKIERGGNYGWSVQEGLHPFRPERKKGPTPILKPLVEHHHSDFRSITGGFVYHGSRLPELKGAYIYGDFDTGRIWEYRKTATPVKEATISRELARTNLRIVGWGEDEAGELYFLDFMGGGLHQLVKAPPQTAVAPPFPKKLSETGLFASTKNHIPAPGVIPYSVNAQLWGDHAHKDRFIAIPGDAKIGFDEITYPQPSPGAPPGWRFPDGTVLVKTFSMDMERGIPQSRKRLETRILHFQQFEGNQDIGDQYWRGYTYVWNDEQTDADLLEAEGKDLDLTIKAGNQTTRQSYRLPSRAECSLCHTNAAKFALGVSTLQMNRDHDYNGVIANQLDTLEHIGLFSKPLAKRPAELPKLADYHDAKQPTESRALSYLHSNCGHCHIKWGGGNAEFKLLSTLPVKEMGIVDVSPNHGNFNIKEAKVLAPGKPDQSVLLHRMSITGLGRMPHVGSKVPDEVGVRLIREWIAGMK